MAAVLSATCSSHVSILPPLQRRTGAISSSASLSMRTRPSKSLKPMKWSLGRGSEGVVSRKKRSASIRCEASKDGRITQQEFTEMAWQAIVSSPELAKESKHQIVETEHLMQALLEQKNGLARRIFSKAGVDNTRLLEATEKFIQRQPKVLGESAGSMLGRDLEALIQRARDYKKEYGDSYVSVEHLVLGYAEDRRFGKQVFKDFQISLDTLKSAIESIRGRQTVIDQDCIRWSFANRLKIRKHRHIIINATVASSGLVSEPKRNLRPRSEAKLHFLEERNEQVLSERLLNLSRSNKVQNAIELYNSIDASGLIPNAHACNSLISCLLRNGSIDDALSVFENARKKETTTAHTYTLVLKAVGTSRGCDAALEMFTLLDENNFDIIVYNTMISINGKAKKWIEAERLWRKIKMNGLTGTMITYDLLISIFVQCGQTELAVDAYHELIEKGFEPTEDMMKAIIASCTKEGNWVLALNVFKKMLGKGIKPNIIAYNSLINCLGKAGEYELAFKIYEEMKSSAHKPDSYTWSALFISLYRSKRYSDALHFFEKIKRESAVQINAHMYNTALMSCHKLGLWERSLQILWEMEESGFQVSTVSYNHVICACEVARKPKVALQVYEHMIQLKVTPDTFTYLSLIRVCVWGSLWMDVEKIVERVTPDASLYNALIHGFCLRGELTLAKNLYTKMREIGLQPDGKTRALMLQHLPENDGKKHHRARCVQLGR